MQSELHKVDKQLEAERDKGERLEKGFKNTKHEPKDSKKDLC